AIQDRLAVLRERWDQELNLVSRIRDIRTKLEADAVAEREKTSVQAGQSPSDPGKVATRRARKNPTGTEVAPPPQTSQTKMRAELAALETELSDLQGEAGLIRVCV